MAPSQRERRAPSRGDDDTYPVRDGACIQRHAVAQRPMFTASHLNVLCVLAPQRSAFT